MIKAYINYPNPHITAHCDPHCGNIQAQHKPEQRYVRVNIITVSDELQHFLKIDYKFAAYPERNDMWLEIDFNDRDFELAVLEHICRLLGDHYSPIKGMKPSIHC